MKLKKGKCHVLRMGRNNAIYWYSLGADCQKPPGSPGGQSVEHEPAMHPCSTKRLTASWAAFGRVLSVG